MIEQAFHKYRSVSDLRSLQKAIRLFEAACSQWRQTATELLMCKIWITSNFSTQFLTAALRPALAIRNILAEVNESGYNQWESALHDLQHPIFQMKPDIILLLLSSMELAFRGDTTPEAVTERIFSAIQAAKRNGNARIVVTLPEPLEEEYLSNSWAYEWRRRICTSLHERVAPDDAVLVDMEPLIRRVGGDAWFSAKYYITAKFPFHPDHTHLYANTLADVVRGILSSPCKMIITDLDNTLWRGIVGEVGWENVDLDEGGKGHSFLRIQPFLETSAKIGRVAGDRQQESARDRAEGFSAFGNDPSGERFHREGDQLGTKISEYPSDSSTA